MSGLAFAAPNRERWSRLADVLAVALAVALPWSTSATEILAVLWLVSIIPTIDPAALRRVLLTPAGGIPVLFFMLAVVGMLWAVGLPFGERVNGLKSIYKFLFIPFLIFHFQRSSHGSWAMIGFLASCVVLLVLSWLVYLVPDFPWRWSGRGGLPGIPIKDYIAQAGEFYVCIFLLVPMVLRAWQERRRGIVVALSLLVLVFFANVIYVATSRTALVVVPVLAVMFACKHLNWRAMAALALAGVIGVALIWTFVAPVHNNVASLWNEVRQFQPEAYSTRAGERLEFWRKSVGFIAAAPIIGHGTGSIRDQFRRSVVGETGMAAVAAENPHNQTLAVAIQFGLVGTLVLYAMWLAHLMLFRGEGFVAWAGLMIVTQNIVGSLFNSHLFDFTQGWGYVIGVGIAAGMVLKRNGAVQATGARADPA